MNKKDRKQIKTVCSDIEELLSKVTFIVDQLRDRAYNQDESFPAAAEHLTQQSDELEDLVEQIFSLLEEMQEVE